MAKKLSIALAGNPNSGKTTVFNALTGARQHVANYPGVTVEEKTGLRRYKDYDIRVVDLPGTYSLTAYSVEELVARNYIIEEHPDVVVDIIDSSNIERNLYLATQLLEMNVPLVLAFNMSDVARQRGLTFDTDTLAQLFGAPIVMMVGNKGEGLDELLETIVQLAERGPAWVMNRLQYGDEIEEELARIQADLDSEHELVEKYGKRWLALKLLENDKEIVEKGHSDQVLQAVETSRRHIAAIFGDEPQIVVADRRYGFISGACQEAVQSSTELRHDISDLADTVLTHRILGLPIFIALMYLVFQLTFMLGEYPMGWLENFFAFAAGFLTVHWPGDPGGPLQSLVVDGII
ncbi:MAG: ferrous iron transporter B, partial [Planctomycetes bacterium]|nr:ferrous iron transporter B [Planctomycetota bacterium]